ncbi:uncharacterized protein PG986_000310 [Apiospora aurea]|uniref:Uncharacterized protein n=1 Tax=Apiospora aurea TaxID=335848 RepID=A0ABR1QUB7_9PEZI
MPPEPPGPGPLFKDSPTKTTSTAAKVAVDAKIWSLFALVSTPTHTANRIVHAPTIPSSAYGF